MWVRISGILRGDDGSKEEQVVEADPIIQARLSVDTGGGGGPAGILDSELVDCRKGQEEREVPLFILGQLLERLGLGNLGMNRY